MKFIKISILFFIISSYTLAKQNVGEQNIQPPKTIGKITGMVLDSVTQQPIDYATIYLSKPNILKPINGTSTDAKGHFKLDNVPTGVYKLTISFMGYKNKILYPITTTGNKPDINLGQIVLSPTSKALKEVVVQSHKDLVENKIDKLVYNAEKDVTSSNGDAGDLLRKVPMVDIDADGNVGLRGSQSVRILINGKPSGLLSGNVGDALKSIPASEIKNIEVITNPSAKYDADGAGGIINIITKKNTLEGITGNVNASIGNRRNNMSANMSAKKGRTGINANINGNWMWQQTSLNNLQRTDLNGNTLLNQNGENQTNRGGAKASVGLDHEFNAFNAITSNINLNGFGFDNNGTTIVNTFQNGTSNSIKRLTNNELRKKSIDWITDYKKTFEQVGKELSFSTQISFDETTPNYITQLTSIDNNMLRQENASNDSKNRELTFQTDYIHPLKNNFFNSLEIGAKSIFRKVESNYHVDTLSINSNLFALAPNRSNDFLYHQNVYAGYTTLNINLPHQVGIKVGGRIEFTAINIASYATNSNQTTTPNYHNFMPNIVIAKTFDKTQSTLKLSYSKRIQRPSMNFLNPFVNASDPKNTQQGNPNLSPEISQTVDLSYAGYIKNNSVNLSLYYRYTSDVIENYVTQSANGTSSATYQNVGNNNSIGVNLFASLNIIPKINIRTSTNVYTYDVTTTLDGGKNTTGILYNTNVNISWSLPKNLVIEGFGNFNSPKQTFQGTTPALSMWSIGLKKDFLNRKMSVGVNIVEPFNNYKNFDTNIHTASFNQTSRFSVPFRSFGMTFAYNFGKIKGEAPKKAPKKGSKVNNDDLKQGDEVGGM